jgi:hypothetical protein
MDKVQKLGNPKCYTPSSESFRIDLLFYPEDGSSTFFRRMVNIYEITRRHIPHRNTHQLFIATRLYGMIRNIFVVKTGISFKNS